MISRTNRIRLILTVIAGAGVLSTSYDAAAQSCTNDIDCPNSACGGQVCDWGKGMTCQPAGVATAGQDGWCTTTADCKCRALGATCIGVYCTFTVPPPAPDAGGAGGSSTGGTSGGSTGGTTGGTDAGTNSSSSSGGCSVGGASSGSLAGLMAAFGSLMAIRRRRRTGRRSRV